MIYKSHIHFARARALAQAEAELTIANIYIPIGAPLRWSLVRGTVDGFLANPYAFHPLPDMAEIPRNGINNNDFIKFLT